MNKNIERDGSISFGGRELFEGESSTMPPIGWEAQFIDALPFNNFAQLMINLGKQRKQNDAP
jgi:hypothetical protein